MKFVHYWKRLISNQRLIVVTVVLLGIVTSFCVDAYSATGTDASSVTDSGGDVDNIFGSADAVEVTVGVVMTGLLVADARATAAAAATVLGT